MSQAPQKTQAPSLVERYICFSLGTEEYAIPLLTVKEVIAMPEITSIPSTPAYFLGIMNLRGQVISVMDMRKKLGVKAGAATETAVIICDLHSVCMGVVVDSVNSVLVPAETDLSEKPKIEDLKSLEYVTKVYRKDTRLVLFLDIARMLHIEAEQIKRSA